MLSEEARLQFEILNEQGQSAKNRADHEAALVQFASMDALALEYNDPSKRIHALTPAARALWSMKRYDEATGRLETAASLAEELGLQDERAITISNMGRIAAVKTVDTVPLALQAASLRELAVPKFRQAYELLRNHPHLYYRYANAQHGSVVAALAGDRKLAAQLVLEGFAVAFRTSPEPYDQRPTYQISPDGRKQMLAAIALIPLGQHTPKFADMARAEIR